MNTDTQAVSQALRLARPNPADYCGSDHSIAQECWEDTVSSVASSLVPAPYHKEFCTAAGLYETVYEDDDEDDGYDPGALQDYIRQATKEGERP